MRQGAEAFGIPHQSDRWDRSLADHARTSVQTVGRDFERTYVLTMAKTLTLAEITVLVSASATKENALALVRAGRLDEGRDMLLQARKTYERADICGEARLSAESFQAAAESFLYYKGRAFRRAEEWMARSIACCHELRDRYGYDVELRRGDLARNMVRVVTDGGQPARGAQMASELLTYLLGDHEAWPLRTLTMSSEPDPLSPAERAFLVDRALLELGRALDLLEDPSMAVHSPDIGRRWLQAAASVPAAEQFAKQDGHRFPLAADEALRRATTNAGRSQH